MLSNKREDDFDLDLELEEEDFSFRTSNDDEKTVEISRQADSSDNVDSLELSVEDPVVIAPPKSFINSASVAFKEKREKYRAGKISFMTKSHVKSDFYSNELQLPVAQPTTSEKKQILSNLKRYSSLLVNIPIDLAFKSRANNISTKLWPLASLGLLIHDLFYFNYSSLRYKTTFSNVLFGFSAKSNLGTILNHMGTDIVESEVLFWAPIASTMGFSIVGALGGKYIKATTKRYINDDKLPLAYKSKTLVIASRIYSLYAYFRLLELFIQKCIQQANYLKEKSSCEQENKIFRYIDIMASYQCLVCDDDKIPLKDRFSTQGCIDGWLANEIDPNYLLSQLNRISDFKDYSDIDFSKQPLSQWNGETFTNILSLLSKNNRHFQSVNFGANEMNYNQLPANIFHSILKFVANNRIDLLDISNQNLSESGQQFILNLNGSSIVSLVADNCMLGEAITHFDKIINQSSLVNVSLANNEFNDLSFCTLWQGVAGSGLQTLSVPSNQLGDISLKCMRNLNQTQIKTLNIASSSPYGFSADGLSVFGKGFYNSSLLQLDMSSNTLSDDEISALAPYFKYLLQLEFLNLSDNYLSESYTAKTFFKNLPLSLKTLFINNMNLDDDGMNALTGYLLNSSTTILEMATNSFSTESWINFFSNLILFKIKKLNLANNFLDNQSLNHLAEILDNSTGGAIESINIESNNLISPGILITFIDACAKALVKEINLARTNANDDVANKLISIMSSKNIFELLNLSDTYISPEQIKNIILSSRSLKSFIAKSIILNDESIFSISSSFLKINDDMVFMKYLYLNEDELDWLNTKSDLINPLQHLSLTLNLAVGIGMMNLERIRHLTDLKSLDINYVNSTDPVDGFQYNNSHDISLIIETLTTYLAVILLLSAWSPIYKIAAKAVDRSLKYCRDKFFVERNPHTNIYNGQFDDDSPQVQFHEIEHIEDASYYESRQSSHNLQSYYNQ